MTGRIKCTHSTSYLRAETRTCIWCGAVNPELPTVRGIDRGARADDVVIRLSAIPTAQELRELAALLRGWPKVHSVPLLDPYWPHGAEFLVGLVWAHPQKPQGAHIRTAAIVTNTAVTIVTRSRTYRLGRRFDSKEAAIAAEVVVLGEDALIPGPKFWEVDRV